MKKELILCSLWIFIGAILLILIFRFADTSFQGLVGKIVYFYIFGSTVVAGILAHMKKKSKKAEMEQ